MRSVAKLVQSADGPAAVPRLEEEPESQVSQFPEPAAGALEATKPVRIQPKLLKDMPPACGGPSPESAKVRPRVVSYRKVDNAQTSERDAM